MYFSGTFAFDGLSNSKPSSCARSALSCSRNLRGQPQCQQFDASSWNLNNGLAFAAHPKCRIELEQRRRR